MSTDHVVPIYGHEYMSLYSNQTKHLYMYITCKEISIQWILISENIFMIHMLVQAAHFLICHTKLKGNILEFKYNILDTKSQLDHLSHHNKVNR